MGHMIEDEIRTWGRQIDGLVSFKVAKLEQRHFKVALDVEDERREQVHDAFAEWHFHFVKAHPDLEDLHWATFASAESQERFEFFAACQPPDGETILFETRHFHQIVR